MQTCRWLLNYSRGKLDGLIAILMQPAAVIGLYELEGGIATVVGG